VLAHLHVLGDALQVLERPVLAPDLARRARDAAVLVDLVLRDRQDETIHVLGHLDLLGRCRV
jgi:hypothetical protein